MESLGAYDSDDDDGTFDNKYALECSEPPQHDDAPLQPVADDAAPKVVAKTKVVINYKSLPAVRLRSSSSSGQEVAAPVREQDAGEAERLARAASSVDVHAADERPRSAAWLPAPFLAPEHVEIDFANAGRPAEKPGPARGCTSGLLESPARLPEISEESGGLPDHPMFKMSSRYQKRARGDGPSIEELEYISAPKRMACIQAEAITDPAWQMNVMASGEPGTYKGKKVPNDMSMYERDKWKETVHSDPSRTQQKKHQINWLAHDAMEREADLLERDAVGSKTKAETKMKYGW